MFSSFRSSDFLNSRLARGCLPYPAQISLAACLLTALAQGGPVQAQTFNTFGGDTTGGSAGALAVGNSTFASNAGAVAIGALGTLNQPTIASGPNALALGNGASALGANSIASGTGASAFNDGAIASGFNSIAGGSNTSVINDIAIGNSARANGGQSVALGDTSGATGQRAIAIGSSAIGSAIETVALGSGAVASGAQSVAIGRAALGQGINSTSIGNGTSAAGFNATSLGYSSTAGGSGATAIGDRSNAAAAGTVAVGRNSTANQAGSIAVGDLASATGTGAIAMGLNTLSSGAIVIGGNASGSGSGTIIGDSATGLGVIAGTAIGSNSAVTVNDGVALGSNSRSTFVAAPANGQAVTINGNNGNNGTVQVSSILTDRTLLGSVSVGNDTNFRQVVNVADGLAPLDAVNVRQLKSGLQSMTTYTDAVATNLQTQITGNRTSINNLNVRVGTLEPVVSTLDKLAVRYVSDANGNPTNTVAFAGTGTGPVALTNVAAGVNTTDAVNMGQLQAVAGVSGNSVQYNLNSTGARTNEITLAGGNAAAPVLIHNVATGVAATDAANTGQVRAAITTANTYTDTAVGDLSRRAVQYAVANGQTQSQINLQSDQGGPVIIHNLAPGVAATDAVNVGQLQQAVANSAGNAVQYDTNLGGQRTNVVTLSGGTAGTPVTVRNVAAGVNPTDAVNVQQMQAGNTTTYNNATAYTDNRVNNLVNLWDQKLRSMDQRIDNVAKDARAGTAMALAASGLRYNDTSGKTTIAGASSVYRGNVGLAFGLGHTSQDGRWRVNAAMTAVPTARKPDIGAVFGASWSLN